MLGKAAWRKASGTRVPSKRKMRAGDMLAVGTQKQRFLASVYTPVHANCVVILHH